MLKMILILKLITQSIPLLVDMIRAVEEAIPGQGKGEQKLAALRAMLEAAYEAAGNISLAFEELWPALQKTISGLVGAFNSAGWGDKKPETEETD